MVRTDIPGPLTAVFLGFETPVAFPVPGFGACRVALDPSYVVLVGTVNRNYRGFPYPVPNNIALKGVDLVLQGITTSTTHSLPPQISNVVRMRIGLTQ